MDDILKRIGEADDAELSAIILEIIDRYSVVHPDWEVCFLSIPKNDPKERKRCIRAVSSMLLCQKSNRRGGS